MESNIVVILFDEPGKAEMAYEWFDKLKMKGSQSSTALREALAKEA